MAAQHLQQAVIFFERGEAMNLPDRDGDGYLVDSSVWTPEVARDSFRDINNWGEGVTMPRFPDEVIEDIIFNRPLELIWPDGI